mmetsp:Transcript_35387/g.87943  ORF Transcript_35387/g.87943 Transcript_35387/m.87943 type:complete len:259 (+) Transcript_35387:4176-4952(+)
MAVTASSHCLMSACRSMCSFLNCSAVRSSSICAACVSVTSFSNSSFFSLASIVSFCTARLRSRIFCSSARWYLSIVRLSSSFCLAATAHCSSSSWFQFISSLNWSSFSLPLKISFWFVFIRSWYSSMSPSNRFNSAPRRAACLLARCVICSSVSISLFLASTRACVCWHSCCTFLRWLVMVWTLSVTSVICSSMSTSRAFFCLMAASSRLLLSLAKGGMSSPSNSIRTLPPSPSGPRRPDDGPPLLMLVSHTATLVME